MTIIIHSEKIVQKLLILLFEDWRAVWRKFNWLKIWNILTDNGIFYTTVECELLESSFN